MKKYECNRLIFKEINTEDEAYWLGFLLADGHNHNNKKIRVDIKDEGHLDKLSLLIYPKGNKPVKIRNLGFGSIYYFDCSILDVVENLNRHGIVPRKSKIATLPIIPEEMYRHFIRGLFDGDGCLTFSMDKNYRRYTFSIVGSYDLMIGVKNIIFNETKINLSDRKMKSIHNVYKRGNQQIMEIMDWLYKDSSVFLIRKHEKYQDMLNFYKSKNK